MEQARTRHRTFNPADGHFGIDWVEFDPNKTAEMAESNDTNGARAREGVQH
jgi:hypothetical protein